MKKTNQTRTVNFKATPAFQGRLAEAARKAGFRTVSAFVRAAIIERAAQAGVTIDPVK